MSISKRTCGTTVPSEYQIIRNDQRLNNSTKRIGSDLKIYIDVQFIHITSKTSRHISKDQREKQISVLNNAFLKYQIEFGYDEAQVIQVENSFWYKMDLGSLAEREAKNDLHGSPERHLNFYTAGISGGLLGWATFPWQLEGNRHMDGVVMLDETLPEGSKEPYNLGITAVHEVGHWLGLYHTHQDGCRGKGDHVGDTPSHSEPNWGKPDDSLRNGACREGELAPVHNYMNYCDDEWLDEFTDKQIERVKRHVAEYRPKFIRES